MSRVSEIPELVDTMATRAIDEFAQGDTFRQRSTFALMCQGLMKENPALFQDTLKSAFTELASDKVVNVRITVARCLKTVM